jgi:hypothetical protein
MDQFAALFLPMWWLKLKQVIGAGIMLYEQAHIHRN